MPVLQVWGLRGASDFQGEGGSAGVRIRSIKPEYWRSDDITTLPISTRLTFIGLWSYVDDNGVGADKLVSIVADLYADDFSRDPLETIQRVTDDLQRLTSGGQVVRFRGLHNGSAKDLLYITKWKQHQLVNHPSLGHKYPLPPEEMVEAARSLTSVSGESLETLTHEQGNRGTEQGSGSRGTEEQRSAPVKVDAYKLVSKVIPSEHPPAVKTMLGIKASELSNAGTSWDDIEAALQLWLTKSNVGPGVLPSLVSEVIKSRDRKPAPAARKVNRGLELAQQLGNDNPPELTA